MKKKRNLANRIPISKKGVMMLMGATMAAVPVAMSVGMDTAEASTNLMEGATSLGLEADDSSQGPINLGFTFKYFGTDYSQVYISTNGLLSFGTGNSAYSNTNMPSTGVTGPTIAPFWDDLVTSGNPNSILYKTEGTAPNRKFIVQWTNIKFYSSPIQLGNFQVILYEGTNNIQFQYPTLMGDNRSFGNSATIGISLNSTTGYQYSFNQEDAILERQAIRYTWNSSNSTYSMNSNASYEDLYLLQPNAPYLPTLSTPIDGNKSSSTANFVWTPATGATSYRLLVAKDYKFSQIVANVSNITSPSYALPGLQNGQFYYWRVEAINANGSTITSAQNFVVVSEAQVTNVTSTKTNGTYKAGDVIDIQVKFNKMITVTGGTPSLQLNSSGSSKATYIGGSNSDTLTFRYTVQAGENVSDLNYASQEAFILNGTSIRDTENNFLANVTLPALSVAASLGGGKDIKIDTAGPAITSAAISAVDAVSGFVKTGHTVAVNFVTSEDISNPTVTIMGQPASVVQGMDRTQWTASYTLKDTDPEGKVPFTISYTDVAGNPGPTVTSTTNGSSLTFDRSAPVATLTQSITDTTNKTVTVEVHASDDSGISLKKWAPGALTAADFAAQGTTITGNTFNVTQNGMYSVYIRDGLGYETVKQIAVSNIDTTIPYILLTPSSTADTSGSVSITADYRKNNTTINADQIALKKWAPGFRNSAYFVTSGDSVSASNQVIVNENGSFTFYVKDTAGNESIEFITINNIDKQAPQISFTPSLVWTNQNVVVTPTISENRSLVKRKWASGTKDTNFFATGGTDFTDSFTISENGTFTIYAKDLAGNEQVYTFTFDKLDKTVPILTVLAENSWTNKKAVISVTGSDSESGVALIKWAQGDRPASYFAAYGNPVLNNRFEVNENGLFTVYIQDQAGNETVQRVEVSTIDSDLPVIKLQVPGGWSNQDVTILTTITDNESTIAAQKWASGEQDTTYFKENGTDITNQKFTVTSNGTYTVYARDASGNEVLTYVTIDHIEKTAPTISLNAANAWTNGDATVQTNITDSDSGIEVKKWAPGNQTVDYFASSGTAFSTNSFNVSLTGTYTVYAKDKAGNESVETIHISNIDTVAPSVTLSASPTEQTSGVVTITLSASDTESGVAEKKYEKGNHSASHFRTLGTGIAGNTIEITENGTYTVYVRDQAGNETVKTIEITNINSTSPTILLTQSAGWTNDKATVTAIITDDGAVAVQKWMEGTMSAADFNVGTIGNDLVNNQFFPEANGTYTVYAKDDAVPGNEAVSTITINTIDKGAPTVNVSAPTSLTNQAVPVTVTATDGLSGIDVAKYATGSFNENNFPVSAAELVVNNRFSVEENGTYTVWVKDKAGNVKTETIEIDNIDITPPTIGYSTTSGWTNAMVEVTPTITDGNGIEVIKWAKGDLPKEHFRDYGNPLIDGKFTVTENGDYTLYARDNAGNEGVQKVTISTIDKNAPSISLEASAVWTKNAIPVTANITVTNSPVAVKKWARGEQTAAYFANNGNPLDSNNQFLATGNDSYTVYVKDEAGNESLAHIKITNIDQTLPSVQVYQSQIDPTNQIVTIGVQASDNESGVKVKKWAKGNITDTAQFSGTDITGVLFNVVENGTYTVYVEDHAGNVTLQTIEITNIDQVAPTITLTADSQPTNQDVIIQVLVEENGSPIEKLKWAAGSYTKEDFRERNVGELLTTTTFIAAQNGTYTVYALDQAGNEAVHSITVTNIDRESPEVIQSQVNLVDASEITLVMNDEITVNHAGGFIVKVNGQDVGIISATSSENSITIKLAEAVSFGQTVTLSYEKENGNVVDKAGNKLDSFIEKAVVNQVGRTGEEQQFADAEKALQKAELFKSMVYVEKAQQLIEALPDKIEKQQLLIRLDSARQAAETFTESADQLVFYSSQVTEYMTLAEGFILDLPDSEPNKQVISERFQLLKEELEQFKNEDTGMFEISLERAQQYVDDNKGFIDSLGEVGELKTAIIMLSQKVQAKIDEAVLKREQIRAAITIVEQAETSKSREDLAAARERVNQLEDGDQKNQLLSRLDEVERAIEEMEAYAQAKANAIHDAIQAISALPLTEQLAFLDQDMVLAARQKVQAAIQLGATQADISNLQTLVACEAKIEELKNTLPRIDVSITPKSSTSSFVMLQVEVQNSGSSIVSKKWLQGDKAISDFISAGQPIEEDQFQVVEEGIYTVYVKDAAGNEVVKTVVVKNKPYQISGSLLSQSGLKASATITLRENTNPTAGMKYVVFQLMKGTTPVSVVAIERSLQTTENVSAYFNVTGTQYSVIVSVLDKELSDQSNVGRSLAEPITFSNQP